VEVSTQLLWFIITEVKTHPFVAYMSSTVSQLLKEKRRLQKLLQRTMV
jgi:hypothetical protein